MARTESTAGAPAAAKAGKEEVFDPRDSQTQSRRSYGPGFGPVATSRGVGGPPGLDGRALAAQIRGQDAGLHTTQVVTTMRYWPATVGGYELKLEPLSPSIGTVVHGADLAAVPGNGALVEFFRQLWLDRRVVFFRDQAHLTRAQHAAFASCFGVQGGIYGEKGLGNDPPAAKGRARFDVSAAQPSAASNWHSDATWAQKPPLGSCLHCHTAPPVGGDTLFCDLYAMWAALPPATRSRLASLQCKHESLVFHTKPGEGNAVALHPAARTHPETGGTALWVHPASTMPHWPVSGLGQTDSSVAVVALLHAGPVRVVHMGSP